MNDALKRVKGRLTRIHLWIGEALHLTRYVCCWDCKWARDDSWAIEKGFTYACTDGEDERIPHYHESVCYCWKAALDDGDGFPALCSPAEAVWCSEFEGHPYDDRG